MPQGLQEFLQTKGFTVPSSPLLPRGPGQPGIVPLAPTPDVTPLDVIKEVPKTIGKALAKPLRVVGKELMKPVSTVAVASEQIGKEIAGEKGALAKIPSKVAGILTGKTERSFSDIWRENLPEHPVAGTVIGTVVDMVADPLNFVGGGLVKGVLLTGKYLAKIPGVQKALDVTKPLFSTATKNKEFDEYIQYFRDLGDFRRAEVIEKARKVQGEISKLKPDEVIQVSNYLEGKTTVVSSKVKQIGDDAQDTYAQWKAIEKQVGVKGGEIEQYAPHIKVKEKRGIFGIAREFSSRLGATKGRKIMKFVDATGEEKVGRADVLGLKETKKGFKDSSGRIYQAQQASIEEINTAFQKKFFEENPAIQLAYRGTSSAKAVTGKEFLTGVKQFAQKSGVKSTTPELKGLLFEPDVAKAIDTYFQSIKPEEIQAVFKVYDGMLNWWKAQALLAPSYHIRNMVSNIWNAFLAGVKSPVDYVQAGMVQMGKAVNFTDRIGRTWTTQRIIDSAKRTRAVDEGWYAKDIPTALESEITKGSWNPLAQNNVGFRLNRRIGTAFENNARLALFIKELKEGKSIDQAAMTVKKFLFDYGDLTTFEKNVMKRIFPFYTWTRKNIPLQLEHLVRQPGKFAGLEKAIQAIEDIGMRNVTPANEKYLSDYIKNNTAMRIRYNEEDKTYYYFLLGNWMPSYQAMDFLAQPLPTLMQMLTPILKTPMEILSNKSAFFRNTLGEYELIERYPGQTVNFLGFNMPRRTATILRNIRLLNELDKLNPGKIFGGRKGEPSIFQKAGVPEVQIPGAGIISPAKRKYGEFASVPSGGERTTGLFLGKFTAYKPTQARKFYQQDTEQRVNELKSAIRNARRSGDKKRIELLTKQLREFLRQRGR